jgi:hemerythrin-like domain-containing protein
MKEFGILTNLKRQHEDLVELSRELLSEAETDNPVSYSSLLRRLSLFEGKLKIHLSMEDSHLYPQLADHASEDIRKLAGDYMREMGGIYDRFNAFVLRWKSDSPPEGFPSAFVEEGKDLMETIYGRIREEEETLFPLLEQIGSDLSEKE